MSENTPVTVIVGGVAGGMSAATRLRRLDEERQIIVVERGEHVSFANCGLPYHVSGTIASRGSLLLQTPAALAQRFRLDVRVQTEAVAIDRAARTITLRDVATGTETSQRFDTLVLSPGATPNTPAALAGDARVHTLRDVADLDRIMESLAATVEDAPLQNAVVLGGGYIGVELAENLVARGLSVTIVQRGPQLLSPLDAEMAAPFADHVLESGVALRLGVEVTGGDAESLTLSDGSVLPADLVFSAIGVRPASGLAAESGLALGPHGGILVDELHRTSDPAIFAVGDVAEKTDAATGEPRLLPLAGLANRHGRAVADTIAGTATPSPRALGTAIVGFRGLTAASTGWNERELRAQGRSVRVMHSHPLSHAGYYPGAQMLSIKLIVDPASDRILGAQAVGRDGVDKRIDVIATAMSAGLSASALADLELAYAPQYGSAKDPVNLLGYLNRNRAAGTDATLQWHELEAALDSGAFLLDVRAPGQLAEGLIPGATHIPVEQLRERHHELPAGRIVVHCRVGQGAHTAARLLRNLGHDVVNLDGGYLTWRDAQRSHAIRDNSPVSTPTPEGATR
ncbi:FAD-dependent oxidoreductase [Microterricola viridarii]|uniref:NADPH-dependent 2,4-dienoyl-CoA reductase, sulfur reductase n=1 Tax=Microterricola viridarii TaxID=412690 RepID=A0A1H1YFA1_9MICO|nr:FAD-dependent oxidoreductase [Microterricola viridarii]SDT20140.1 NADPH-dependent 2,4-dienoyl-CoA reductase, sulfur reductase [Microterricola viridarii]